MRFHLIDRIDAYEPGAWIRGRKLTTPTEEYWDTTAGEPLMPPELILEALCQAGQWLLIATTDARRRGALISVGEAHFLSPVRPGEVITLEARVESLDEESAVIAGEASVGDRLVLRADGVMAVLVAGEDFEDPDSTRRFLRDLLAGGS